MKIEYKGAVGIVFGSLVAFYGGLSPTVKALCIIMCIDYISGVIASIIRGDKLSSRIGAAGLLRKVYMLIVIYMCSVLEGLAGIDIAADVVAVSMIANEVLSVLENSIDIGVPLPDIIYQVVSHTSNSGRGRANNERWH